jgi:hypothetical protein
VASDESESPDGGDIPDQEPDAEGVFIHEGDLIHRELLGEDEWSEIVEILSRAKHRAREGYEDAEKPEQRQR